MHSETPSHDPLQPEPQTAAWFASPLLSRLRPWLIGAAVLVMGALILFALHRLLQQIDYAEIVRAVRRTPLRQELWAVLATVASYGALMGYDASSLRYIGASVAPRVVALTSFIAYALGNTIGLGWLTGGAVRLRLYTAAGVDPAQVARAIAFNAASFGWGLSVIAGVALLWGAEPIAGIVHVPAPALRAIAGALIGLTVLLLVLSALRTEIALGNGFRLRLPGWKLTLGQLVISAADMLASALVLWVLMPSEVLGFPSFLAFYSIGIALGILSHVPGGLGVFDAVMLMAAGSGSAAEQVAGALVLYRLIYYLMPLMLASVLLAGVELKTGLAALPAIREARRLLPAFLGSLTLAAAVVLLFSGATPTQRAIVEWQTLHLPLPLIEASHFLSSVAGLLLIFVARGLLHRLDAAWWAAVALTGVSLVFTAFKGYAWTELSLFAVLLISLLAARREFDRRASLFTQHFSGPWLLAMGSVLAASLSLLFFAYRDVEYGQELWWSFEFDAHAPRSLRAMVAVALAGLGLAFWQLLRRPGGEAQEPDARQLDQASVVVQAQAIADAGLALLGDKSFLFSQSEAAFIMYGKRGRSWIALYGPVGPRPEWSELVWRFIEMADEHGGRAAFYHIRPDALPMYLDAGLRAYKLGEEAYVPLPGFDLKGSRRSNLRHGVNRAEREGLTLEIIPRDIVASHMPALRAISDAWLAEHNTREKGFSLGYFDEAYLVRQPVAAVLYEGKMVAFATLMTTALKEEASVDLMRQLPNAPRGTMDFLFVRLMLHFRDQGYQRFCLGMAPLSGMAEHPLAPAWHRVGRMLFSRAENFYNFQGLRAFKEKFDPVWEPRYLAAEGGLAPLIALTDVAALISGGLKGVISK